MLFKQEDDMAWGDRVGLRGENRPTANVTLFALLRLIADADRNGNGLACWGTLENCPLLKALRQADPEQRWWHLEGERIWRRKEWEMSYNKTKAEMLSKELVIANQSKYNESKELLMSLTLMINGGNKRKAEKQLAPITISADKLHAAAAKFRLAQKGSL